MSQRLQSAWLLVCLALFGLFFFITLQTLQRRVTPRVRLRPGRRYRVTARVTFQLGTGSPPVRFTTVVRVCASRHVGRPAFTG